MLVVSFQFQTCIGNLRHLQCSPGILQYITTLKYHGNNIISIMTLKRQHLLNKMVLGFNSIYYVPVINNQPALSKFNSA